MSSLDKAVYASEADFDTAAIVRGLNTFRTMNNLVGDGIEATGALVAGRIGPPSPEGREGFLVYRVIVSYVHKETGLVGVIYNDITEELLRMLESSGKGE